MTKKIVELKLKNFNKGEGLDKFKIKAYVVDKGDKRITNISVDLSKSVFTDIKGDSFIRIKRGKVVSIPVVIEKPDQLFGDGYFLKVETQSEEENSPTISYVPIVFIGEKKSKKGLFGVIKRKEKEESNVLKIAQEEVFIGDKEKEVKEQLEKQIIDTNYLSELIKNLENSMVQIKDAGIFKKKILIDELKTQLKDENHLQLPLKIEKSFEKLVEDVKIEEKHIKSEIKALAELTQLIDDYERNYTSDKNILPNVKLLIKTNITKIKQHFLELKDYVDKKNKSIEAINLNIILVYKKYFSFMNSFKKTIKLITGYKRRNENIVKDFGPLTYKQVLSEHLTNIQGIIYRLKKIKEYLDILNQSYTKEFMNNELQKLLIELETLKEGTIKNVK